MTEFNHNAVSFAHFLLPECYITIPVSFIFFMSLFMLTYYILMPRFIHPKFDHIKTNPLLHYNIANGFVSMIHGFLSLSLCISFHHVLFLHVTHDITSSSTSYEVRLIASVSFGYFIYDLVVANCLNLGSQSALMIVHHFVSLAGLLVAIIAVYGGRIVIVSVFISEVTNPILHINNLKNRFTPMEIQSNSKRFAIYNVLIKSFYLFFYCIARFVVGGHITYQILFVHPTNICIQITGSIFITVSLILLPMNFKDIMKSYANYKAFKVNTVKNNSAGTLSNTEAPLQYENVLHLSKISVFQYIFTGTIHSFFRTNRMAVYVLYAEQLGSDFVAIAALLYALYFWNGLGSLLYSSLANEWRYDKVIILLLVLQFTAVLLESVAPSFAVLFIGAILSQVSVGYVTLGYIAWILPHEQAAVYTSYFYGVVTASYLIGPISAGVVSFYITTRAVFIINAVVCFCALIHGFFCIYNTQTKLEGEQLLVGISHNQDKNMQFPIFLHQEKQESEETEEDKKCKSCTLPQMSRYEWFMLISMLFINGTVSIAETSVVVYYALYVVEVLDGNVIIGTGGILAMSLTFIIGNLLVPKFCKSDIKYLLIIICLAFEVFITLYLFPSVQSLPFYWLFCSMCGLSLGAISMASEMILLEIQPTEDSGKISGVKGLTRNWLNAAAMYIIAMLWVKDQNSFWYANACSFGAALLLSFAVAIAKYTHTSNK